MQERGRRGRAGLVAAAVVIGAATLISSASGAASRPIVALEARPIEPAVGEHAATLEIYALDAELERARAAAATALADVEAATQARDRARAHLQIARRNAVRAQKLLGRRLRALYVGGEAHPLEIVLGAASLAEAFEGLDGLTFAAARDRKLVVQARGARRRIAAEAARMATRARMLRRAAAEAAARAVAVSRARAERAAYLERLAQERVATAHQLGAREQVVETVQARAEPAATVTAAPAAAPAAKPAMLTVVATGYSLRGRTATGLPVARGVVAVDPSVIPLGTRLTIPGYGSGVAADVGPGVRGAHIDLWFPTRRAALAWGTRTVTIRVR